MKKATLVMAAAALAAIGMAPRADAGEVKLGGLYQFRGQTADSTVDQNAATDDNEEQYLHRLQLNWDFNASKKTHAHAVLRLLDSATVTGVNGNASATLGTAQNNLKQAWLETEAWGVGAKAGYMPIALNDSILVGYDTTGYGALMLSKTFGDVTGVLAHVKVAEGNVGDTGTAAAEANQDDDDQDLYVLSLLGKASTVNYQVTGAYWDSATGAAGADPAGATGNGTLTTAGDTDNFWLAGTLNTALSGIDLTGTLIWESGWDGYTADSQEEEGDFLAALRAKGKTGFGGWNGYVFYSGEDFNNIVGTNAKWSPTWDMGGPGARDLMNNFALGRTANTAVTNNNAASNTENMWGIGAGLEVPAGIWTVKPHLDYAAVVEDFVGDATKNGIIDYDTAWGGSLILSTNIDTDTELNISGHYVDPDNTTTAPTVADQMHYVQASVAMKF
ncbi:MAG: hypothetical protein HQM02_13890 [Magnetococcales bacterium]|nr:hypothetical protein [Magnetococcales bacterium]